MSHHMLFPTKSFGKRAPEVTELIITKYIRDYVRRAHKDLAIEEYTATRARIQARRELSQIS